jgi:hypothetical protein
MGITSTITGVIYASRIARQKYKTVLGAYTIVNLFGYVSFDFGSKTIRDDGRNDCDGDCRDDADSDALGDDLDGLLLSLNVHLREVDGEVVEHEGSFHRVLL